jgi:pyrroloquinoline quinone biosynthesis protein B
VTTSFIILGSGQDGGAPQFGNASSVSQLRSASSVAVVSSDGTVVLLDASPDIRSQWLALLDSPIYLPDRRNLIDAVFITHAHMGHYSGLLHFGKEAAATNHVPLGATPSFLNFLRTNDPWSDLVRSGHLDPMAMVGNSVVVDDTLAVTAVPVPHRGEYSDTVAMSVSINRRPWMLYLPDIDDWDSWPGAEEEIANHDVALIDATFSSSDELHGRDIEAVPHPLVPDTIARFRHLTSETQMILTHMNHSNPLGLPEAVVTQQAVLAGFRIAFDGYIGSGGT